MIARQLGRLAKHSAIYGLGAVVARLIGVFLLPIITRYLPDPTHDLGAIETLLALAIVLVTVLRAGISMAFFRFYFDAEDERGRVTVVRTSFWFTMTMATLGLVVGVLLAEPISEALFSTDRRTGLVRAAFLVLWAQMNYEQLTSLFRVESTSSSSSTAASSSGSSSTGTCSERCSTSGCRSSLPGSPSGRSTSPTASSSSG